MFLLLSTTKYCIIVHIDILYSQMILLTLHCIMVHKDI